MIFFAFREGLFSRNFVSAKFRENKNLAIFVLNLQYCRVHIGLRYMVEIAFRCNFSVMFEDLSLCMLNIFIMFLLLSAYSYFQN